MSIAFTISYSEYKELIDHAYKNRGGIDGQRGTLKTSTAIRIRKRMEEEHSKGTRYYGLQIGLTENKYCEVLDKIWQLNV